MRAEARQFPADVLGRKHEVNATQAYGGARHAGEMGRFVVLREGNAAFALNRLHRQRPVRAAAGQDHADGVGALIFGEGVQQIIDRHGRPKRFASGSQGQATLRNPHAGVGRDDVQMIRFDGGAFGCLPNRHRGFFGQNFNQKARMVRIQVLRQQERHSAGGRQAGKQLCHRFQPARRCADADDGKRFVRLIRRSDSRQVFFAARGSEVGSGIIGNQNASRVA